MARDRALTYKETASGPIDCLVERCQLESLLQSCKVVQSIYRNDKYVQEQTNSMIMLMLKLIINPHLDQALWIPQTLDIMRSVI